MPPTADHDVIVVGAGHNGLIVAYLAKAGLDVCIVERNDFLGGCTNSREVTLPGFKHDTMGAVNGGLLGNPIMRNDELGLLSTYGLEYIRPDFHEATLFPDDTAIEAYLDLDKTCESIAQFSQRDAGAYRKFVMMGAELLPLFAMGQYSPAPRFGAFMQQLDSSPTGRELMRCMMMSAWDLATEWFEHPKTIMRVLRYPVETMIGPDEKGTGLYLLLAVPSGHFSSHGLPVGGCGEMPAALGRCLEDHGGTIMINSEVTQINTRNGKAVGVTLADGRKITASRGVVSNVDPRLSLLEWLDCGVDQNIRAKLERVADPTFSGIMQSIALDEAPIYKASANATNALNVFPMPATLEAFMQNFDDLRYGKIPRQGACPIAICPTVHDPSRAPEGKHVLYLWQFMPYKLADGGPQRWDKIKDKTADWVLDNYLSYTSNLSRKNILGNSVMSPIDLERVNPNIVRGSILGPASTLHQSFSHRPIPELGSYRTPVEGLFLSGLATHPGGAILGGGRAAVQAIMADLGINFDKVIA
jgi:beta-carotene ketolase (CrtO type)